jgi:hypothetical protein
LLNRAEGYGRDLTPQAALAYRTAVEDAKQILSGIRADLGIKIGLPDWLAGPLQQGTSAAYIIAWSLAALVGVLALYLTLQFPLIVTFLLACVFIFHRAGGAGAFRPRPAAFRRHPTGRGLPAAQLVHEEFKNPGPNHNQGHFPVGAGPQWRLGSSDHPFADNAGADVRFSSELSAELGLAMNAAPTLAFGVSGSQQTGKSTLMNTLLGSRFAMGTLAHRITNGIHGVFNYVVPAAFTLSGFDCEGINSPERDTQYARAWSGVSSANRDVKSKAQEMRLALSTILISDAVGIIMNQPQNNRDGLLDLLLMVRGLLACPLGLIRRKQLFLVVRQPVRMVDRATGISVINEPAMRRLFTDFILARVTEGMRVAAPQLDRLRVTAQQLLDDAKIYHMPEFDVAPAPASGQVRTPEEQQPRPGKAYSAFADQLRNDLIALGTARGAELRAPRALLEEIPDHVAMLAGMDDPTLGCPTGVPTVELFRDLARVQATDAATAVFMEGMNSNIDTSVMTADEKDRRLGLPRPAPNQWAYPAGSAAAAFRNKYRAIMTGRAYNNGKLFG